MEQMGVGWLQMEEPFLSLDLDEQAQIAFQTAYRELADDREDLKLLLTTYFEGLGENTELACGLPVEGLHIDVVEAPDQLESVMAHLDKDTWVSLGLMGGRTIWKAALEQ